MPGVETVESDDDSAANDSDVEAGNHGKSNYEKRSAGDFCYLFV